MDSWTRSSTKSSQSRCTSAYTVPASRHVSSKRQTGSAVSNDCDPSVMALAGLHITLRRATTDVWRTGSDHEKDASSVSGVSVGRVSAVSGSSVSRFKSGTNVYSRHRPLLATREKAVRGVAIGEGGGKTGSRHSKKNCDACSVQYMRHWFKARAEGRSESSLTQIGSDLQSERPQLYMVDQQSGLRPESTGAQGMSLPTVSVPASGLIKLTGLQHEMADPGYYEKRRQAAEKETYERLHKEGCPSFQHRKSAVSVRQNSCKSVLRQRPEILEHVKAGERLLKYTENEMQRSQLEEQQDYEGLLQDILLYEIPGLSKPQN